jgi:hypothetical protein
MHQGVPELRKPVMIVIEATWEDENGATQTTRARVENNSGGGACIRATTAIAPGSKVRIRWRFDEYTGIVKYCRAEGREYLVGLQRDTVKNSTSTSLIAEAPLRKDSGNNLRKIDPLVSATISEAAKKGAPKGQESRGGDIPNQTQKAETQSAVRRAGNAAAKPPRGFGRITTKRDRPNTSKLRDTSQPGQFGAPQIEDQAKQPPEQTGAGEEGKHMVRKWFQRGSSKQDDLIATSPENSDVTSEENLMPHATQHPAKDTGHSTREAPSCQVELLPIEDIYRAAGIMSPQKGYSVNKVVEMLNSAHIRGLSKEMKRAAVLMALDAAGVSIDQIRRDAKARLDSLDGYEAEQKKQADTEWSRQAEAVTEIQAELENIKVQYAARINRCLESVARDKARFNSWVTEKQQQTQSMAEALELCNPPVSEAASSPHPELSLAASATGTKS